MTSISPSSAATGVSAAPQSSSRESAESGDRRKRALIIGISGQVCSHRALNSNVSAAHSRQQPLKTGVDKTKN